MPSLPRIPVRKFIQISPILDHRREILRQGLDHVSKLNLLDPLLR
jgi:hypothetical protein